MAGSITTDSSPSPMRRRCAGLDVLRMTCRSRGGSHPLHDVCHNCQP